MNRRLHPGLAWLLVLGVLSGLGRSIGFAATSPSPLLNDPVAGQALAADVLNLRPVETEFRGTLKMRQRDGSTTNVAVKSQIVHAEKSWQAIYTVTDTNRSETLVVQRSPGRPNEYRHARGDATACVGSVPLSPQDIWRPFAGSDFVLADFGLEFLHWPTQVVLFNEMRKNRACHVLESRPAVTNVYSRVVSWVDVESIGIVMAEAYGPDGKRLKEFEVNGLKKVGDQWVLREMTMRNLKNRSRSIFEFDVTEK